MSRYRLCWSDAKRAWIAKWKDPETGFWRNTYVPCQITHEADARTWMDSWWATSRGGKEAPAPTVERTIGQLFVWWTGYLKEKPGVDPRAAEDAERTHRLWVQPFAFDKVIAQRLEVAHCTDWVEDVQRKARDEGKSPLTVRNVVQMGRAMVADAQAKGLYKGENLLKHEAIRKRIRATGPSVIVHIVEADVRKMVDYRGDQVPLRRHCRNVLAALTGMRAAELAALRWCDLEFEVSVPHVFVHRQYVARLSLPGKPAFKPPKRNSKRRIPLHREALRLLKEWHRRAPHARPEDPIFGDEVTGGYTVDFRTAEVTLDLLAYGAAPTYEGKVITPHAFRRTCLTLLTDAGVSDNDVKLIAGHAQKGVTRAHYVERYLKPLQVAVDSLLPIPSPKKSRNQGGNRAPVAR